jgi:hypothetical protein
MRAAKAAAPRKKGDAAPKLPAPFELVPFVELVLFADEVDLAPEDEKLWDAIRNTAGREKG